MNFDNLLTEFESFESEKNYWFLRTMKGKFFSGFVDGGYIGINWNYVTAEQLRNGNERMIKDIIEANERDSKGNLYDSRTTKGKSKITSIYNKIIRFKELKNGDIVVIPSNGSKYLAFGIITDNEIYNNFDDDRCDFHKRRKVHWIKTVSLENLDSIWYKIIFSMHAISQLNSYASHIDKIISSVFVKGDRAHLVLEVKKEGDINYDSMNAVLINIRSFTELINSQFNLGENLTNNSVKLNVQSPGTIELLYQHGRSLLLASILLSVPIVTSCSHGNASEISTSAQKLDEKNANLARLNDAIDKDDKLDAQQKQGVKDFVNINYDQLAEAKQSMHEIDSIINNDN
ncbi:hypothetical protein [Flavobacterium granuli]|uniref:Uncharacterized protein n=1 Tax=Flavobacterium granuli TaxID=280093 RepID=A0A1M5U6Y9_9FLAO|nr:hypothetical protein [Flavobacterium granuli]PRZ19574.1 hypothetical protein BC624_11622 [Flavobacterium granuli]SHH58651.1 hypothetical protein SAMN05443373_11822 [Flavobacterium granuli]